MSNISDTSNDKLYIYYLSLLKSALDGTKPQEIPNEVTFRRLYAFSSSNHTSHMLRGPLSSLTVRPEPEIDSLFMQQYAKSVTRNAEQQKSYDEIIQILTSNDIDILPIKGIELKSLYPSPFVRRMSDIDLVYDSHNNDKIVKTLMESIGYSCESWDNGHHDIFHRLPVMNVELHRRVDYTEYFDAPQGLIPDENTNHLFHLSHADFYVLLLKHDAKHMSAGGLGVRAISDIYILKKHLGNELESKYINNQLEKYGLVKFAKKLNNICDNWFGDHEPVIDDSGRIILSGYTYGNIEDSEMLRLTNQNKNSKFMYLSSRIFPGIEVMKTRYRVLSHCPLLLPIFWIIRGFSVLFAKKRRDNIKTMKKVISTSEDNIKKYEFMIKEFGLDRCK